LKTNGPGKYDDACTVAREMTSAVACVLIVIEGDQGNGFSVQTLEPDLIPVLPALLREVARGIEAQNRANADA
jgi:hypothetical protein